MAENTLKGFLFENAIKKENTKYSASKRFIGEDKKPIEWEIRALTNDELDKLATRFTKQLQVKGTNQYTKDFDRKGFELAMTVQAVVFPDLDSEELQQSYGVVGAEDLLKSMLTPGELSDLQLVVNEASDFEVGMKEKIKQVKNS